MKLTTPWFSRILPTSESRRSATTQRRTRDRSLRSRPRFDTLEGRQLLSGVFTVSNTNDSGAGSLRAAILASNASPIVSQTFNLGPASAVSAPFNIIQFSLPAGSTISPVSPLPAITEPVETFAPININASGTMVPTIVLDGSKAGVGAVGLDIQTSGNNITDLAIDDFSGGGVLFDGAAASSNWLGSDYIGVNLAGNAGAGNGTFGVEARGGASGNYIVGNVISASSGNGVVLTGSGTSNNLVQNDKIGTDATGSFALGNGGSGVVINLGASGNTLSGDVISGNGYYGVYLSDSGTSNNVVSGSDIGTNAAGTAGIGNGVNGVEIMNGASYNTIGGTTSTARDVISANGGTGVVITNTGSTYNVVEGDYIGTDVTGNHALGNAVYGVILSGGESNNDIGTMQAGAGDVISGNQYGVYITDAGTMLNWVEGDLIGTNAADTYAVGNTYGVEIASGASSNAIYGDVISGNAYGVLIFGSSTTGNYVYFNEIGTDASGTIAIGNSFCGVEVYQSSNNDILFNTVAYSGYFGIINGSASNTYAYNNVYYSGYTNMLSY